MQVPMACADLITDRTMEGLTYSISEGLVADGSVPTAAEISATRTELGSTELVFEMSNLRAGYVLSLQSMHA
jgi:hypothetical protein